MEPQSLSLRKTASPPSPSARGNTAVPILIQTLTRPNPLQVRSVLALVAAYVPADMALEAPLRPFIPDFVPAVAAPDDFIKVRCETTAGGTYVAAAG